MSTAALLITTSSTPIARRLASVLAWVLACPMLALAAGPAPRPGPLADPTRPPTMAMPASAAASTARSTQVPPVRATSVASEPRVGPVLQAVQVPTRGPATAVVDGRMVQAGDRVDGRTVLSIDAQGLVLRAEPANGTNTTSSTSSGNGAGAGTDRLWLLTGATKQAPGSILITRGTSFVAAPVPAEPRPTDRAASGPERERGDAPSPPNAPAGALSLAGSKSP